jgi:hypothetical protein
MTAVQVHRPRQPHRTVFIDLRLESLDHAEENTPAARYPQPRS